MTHAEIRKRARAIVRRDERKGDFFPSCVHMNWDATDCAALKEMEHDGYSGHCMPCTIREFVKELAK